LKEQGGEAADSRLMGKDADKDADEDAVTLTRTLMRR